MSTSRLVTLPTEFTDGDMGYWPVDYDFNPEDCLYHKKLAIKWLDETRSEVTGEPQFRFLPRGYRVYTKARLSGPVADRIDRYIYGHPNGRFTSPNQFWPHFLWLMAEGKGDCACIRCNSSSVKVLSSEGDSTKFSNRAKKNVFDTSVMGENIQILNDPVNINAELRIMATYCDALEIDKEAKLSIAYDGKPLPANRKIRPPTPSSFREETNSDGSPHSFEPRIGEIVLFLRNDEGLVSFHRRTQSYLVMEKGRKKIPAFPTWRAGVVSELSKGPVALMNLTHVGDIKDLSGLVMVEILSTHFHEARKQRKQRKQRSQAIPISRTRPFSMFRELLNGLPQSAWHETVKYAFNSMAGNAHCAAYRFEGQYPSGDFQCRAIWIGNELFRPGDAARIISRDTHEHEKLIVEDVLIISAITITAILVGGRMSVCYSVQGKKYSVTKPSGGTYQVLDTARCTEEDLAERQLPTSMRGYKWYEVSGTHTVGPVQILGRLYEKAAMIAMINSSSLGVGLKGVHEARKFKATERTKHCGGFHRQEYCLEWFRDRIQMLDMDNSKNVDFGEFVPLTGLDVVNSEPLDARSDEDHESDDEGDHQGEDADELQRILDMGFNGESEIDIPIYPSKRARAS